MRARDLRRHKPLAFLDPALSAALPEAQSRSLTVRMLGREMIRAELHQKDAYTRHRFMLAGMLAGYRDLVQKIRSGMLREQPVPTLLLCANCGLLFVDDEHCPWCLDLEDIHPS